MMQHESMQDGANVPDGARGCGQRLSKAREAAGLSLEDVAARLRMPVRVVRSLEEEDWNRLGAPVFVRGQLRSYSRLLGLTTAPMMDASGVAPVAPPMLKPRTYTPTSRRIAESLARRLVYIVLTVAIAVPVWLATRSQLGDVTLQVAPLDVPALGAADPETSRKARQSRDPATVVASIATLAPRNSNASASLLALSLEFTGDSWIEVVDTEGKRLEESLVHAGERRNYAGGQVGQVVLGNAAAVEVRRGGRLLDLEPYQRANVARFTVSSDGSLAPAAD